MQVVHLFTGNALLHVDEAGRVGVPQFVRSAVERRGDARRIVFGLHERSPCLTAWDPAFGPVLYAAVERRRLREEAAGGDGDDRDERERTVFGATEPADYSAEGEVVLPAMMREFGCIDDLALFVGAGGSFEIWNPDLARLTGGPILRRLAEYRLRQGPTTSRRKERR